MSTQQALALPPSAPSTMVVINGRATLRVEGEERVVVVAGLPVHHYSVGDHVAEAYAMVFLVEAGFAQQNEIARAFGCSVRTVRRHQRRYAEAGMAALGTRSGWRPSHRRVAPKRIRVVERLKDQGMSNREIARRLGVTENAIRKLVGPSRQGEQGSLVLATTQASERTAGAAASGSENPSSPSVPSPSGVDSTQDGNGATGSDHDSASNEEEAVPMSLDVDAADRSFDRR